MYLYPERQTDGRTNGRTNERADGRTDDRTDRGHTNSALLEQLQHLIETEPKSLHLLVTDIYTGPLTLLAWFNSKWRGQTSITGFNLHSLVRSCGPTSAFHA